MVPSISFIPAQENEEGQTEKHVSLRMHEAQEVMSNESLGLYRSMTSVQQNQVE